MRALSEPKQPYIKEHADSIEFSKNYEMAMRGLLIDSVGLGTGLGLISNKEQVSKQLTHAVASGMIRMSGARKNE